jgi:type II secretory ATPase GspE/PulE/Tfp pilus assembly ATPase PilB-like protein
MDASLRKAVLSRADAAELRAIYEKQPGYASMRQIGDELAERGITDPPEVARVLGGANG